MASDELVERMCVVMHDAYEDAAVREGWATQERSRKPWAVVPDANKRTMRAAVRAALTAVEAEREWEYKTVYGSGGAPRSTKLRRHPQIPASKWEVVPDGE